MSQKTDLHVSGHITDETAEKLGHDFISLLGLTVRDNKVFTEWGVKTPTGLGHTIINFLRANFGE